VSRRDEILERVRTVPALPKAAVDVIDLLRNPDVSAAELVEVIEYDPMLTSNILRVANSVYFAGPQSVSTLREAIVRLGMKRVFQLVMTTAITPYARQPIRGYDLPTGELLKHAVAVAIGTEHLAAAVGREGPPFAFTAGLLHNLGKVVLGTFLEMDPQPILAAAYEEGLSFEVAERQVLGTDHAEVGAELLESWSLPAGLTESVRWHHRPEDFEGETFVVDLVHVADTLSVMTGAGMGVDGLNYHLSPEVLERLGMTTSTAETVMSEIVDSLDEMQAVFTTDLRR
jgi:putative nucleotidyltransferase with HDIG domain